MYTKDDLMNPKVFTRGQLVELVMSMQYTDRRIFSATVLGSLLQTSSGVRLNDQQLVDSAVDFADLLIETLDEVK